MSQDTVGPMTVGEGVPTVKKATDPEGTYGAAMNPGGDDAYGKPDLTSRTSSKFKSFRREPVPMTKG